MKTKSPSPPKRAIRWYQRGNIRIGFTHHSKLFEPFRRAAKKEELADGGMAGPTSSSRISLKERPTGTQTGLILTKATTSARIRTHEVNHLRFIAALQRQGIQFRSGSKLAYLFEYFRNAIEPRSGQNNPNQPTTFEEARTRLLAHASPAVIAWAARTAFPNSMTLRRIIREGMEDPSLRSPLWRLNSSSVSRREPTELDDYLRLLNYFEKRANEH